MKKCIVFLLVFSILFLCACGKKDEKPTTFPSSATQNTTQEENTSLTGAPDVTQLSPRVEKSTVVDTENLFNGYPINLSAAVTKGNRGADSLSGLTPLEKVSFSATPPRSDIELSHKKQSHSHGPASGGKAHHTVVDFQKNFDRFGAYTLGKEEDGNGKKILYLTFDCGYEYENLTSTVLDVLKEKNVPAAFFCTLDHIKKETEIISRMINEGHIVGNHSATHPNFTEISREKMAKELEETENYLRENYGYASRFFRFPAGEYTENALDLVASLGYVSVFWSVAYNDWNVDNIQGKDYAVKTVTERLHPGAVILLHSVSRDNASALPEIIDRARAEGYEFRSLDQYGHWN